MPAFITTIANAVRNVIANLTESPTTVEVRESDEVLPRDPDDIVIITHGDWSTVDEYSGAGEGDDFGGLLVGYQIGVSIYRRKLTRVNSELTNRPSYILLCKQSLNRPTLVGAPSVYGVQLVSNPTWENVEFRKGIEKSVFGLVFLSSETRSGG